MPRTRPALDLWAGARRDEPVVGAAALLDVTAALAAFPAAAHRDAAEICQAVAT